MIDSKIIIKKLISLNIPYQYSNITKSLFIPKNQIYIFNLNVKNIEFRNTLIMCNSFNIQKNKKKLFNKINYQERLENNLLKNIQKLRSIKNMRLYIIFYKNFSILNTCNKSFPLMFMNIDIQKNLISEGFLDVLISLISISISNFSVNNIIVLKKFRKLLDFKKNNLHIQKNYYYNYDVNLITYKYHNEIKKKIFVLFKKKNILKNITGQNDIYKLSYNNNLFQLHIKNFISITSFSFFNKNYTYNNYTFKENKKKYGTTIFSNYDKRYDVKKSFYKKNFFYKKKYNFYLNKKKFLNSINLKKSNLENSYINFDYINKSNFVLDIGEITKKNFLMLDNYKQDNSDKCIFLVNRKIINIENLAREIKVFSELRNNSIEVLNINFIEPENPSIPYIPIKKNEFFDRTLHLVPWFILFFFIILLITSFYSFKKLTKKITDSNINFIYSIKKYIEDLT